MYIYITWGNVYYMSNGVMTLKALCKILYKNITSETSREYVLLNIIINKQLI